MTLLITDIWEWLRNEDNRAVVRMLGAGFVIIMAAAWAVFKYYQKAPQAVASPTASADRGGVALRDMYGGTIHVHNGVGAEELRGIIEPIVASNRGKDEQIVELTKRLDLTEGAVRSFFATVDANQVPRENWPEALANIAADYARLRDEVRAMEPDDEEGAKKKEEALRALEAGDYEQAEALLAEWEQADLVAAERGEDKARHHRRRAAEARASRGDLAMTQIDYVLAAEHFEDAAAQVREIDAAAYDRYVERRANASYRHGLEKGDNEGLELAIELLRDRLRHRSRDRVPLEWARTQVNLGNALRGLGERESGTARLEEAVAAYREALKECARDRVPLDWAMTQMNLGNALQTLGARESGTARLEEAVAAYREALEECTRDRVPLDWAMTQMNLGNALLTLGARESGTARLKEAVAAYRAALEECTRDRLPLGWAMTQMNLGNALARLGEREPGTARLKEAVAACQAALEVFNSTGPAADAARTRHNLEKAERILNERRSP